jgi:hypothetical protein
MLQHVCEPKIDVVNRLVSPKRRINLIKGR